MTINMEYVTFGIWIIALIQASLQGRSFFKRKMYNEFGWMLFYALVSIDFLALQAGLYGWVK